MSRYALGMIMGLVGCTPAIPTEEVPTAYFMDGLYGQGWYETVAPPSASRSGVLATWWLHYDGYSGYDGYGVFTWDLFTGEYLGQSEKISPDFGSLVEGPPVMSAIDDDGFILNAGDRFLSARDEVGNIWWRVPLGGLATSSVAIGRDHRIYVGVQGGVYYAFSRDGNPLWALGLPGDPYGHPALDAQEASWCFVKRPDASWQLVRISSAGELERVLDTDIPVGSVSLGQAGEVLSVEYTGPALADPPDPADFFLRAYDPDTGSIMWEAPTEGQAYAPLVGPDGHIYVAAQAVGEGGHLLALNPTEGAERWRVDLPGDVWQPVILDNGLLVVGCGGDLCGFDLDSGREVFDWVGGEGVTSVIGPPLAQDGLIVANTDYGYFVWELGGSVATEARGWPRLGADNQMTGRAR